MNVRLTLALSLLAGNLACSSTTRPESPVTWQIQLTDEHGNPLGTIAVEMTATPARNSCLGSSGEPPLLGLVTEKPSRPDLSIGKQAAVQAQGGEFFMDLNLGACDGNACLVGEVRGRTAHGEVQENTIAGPLPRGRFEAHRY